VTKNKDVDKKIKSKKTVDGFYYDNTGSYVLYKDENGYMSRKKSGKK